jgi:hypothetical protein
VLGENKVNGKKTPLRILLDTGSSSFFIIVKKFISKNTLFKKKENY